MGTVPATFTVKVGHDVVGVFRMDTITGVFSSSYGSPAQCLTVCFTGHSVAILMRQDLAEEIVEQYRAELAEQSK